MRPVQPGIHDPWQWLERQLHEERFGTARVILHDLGARLHNAIFRVREDHISTLKFWRDDFMFKLLRRRQSRLSRLTGRLRAVMNTAPPARNGTAVERRWLAQRTAFWKNLIDDAGIVRGQIAYERRQRIKQMVFEGMTRQQIADRIGVSTSRVGAALDRYYDSDYRPVGEYYLQRKFVLKLTPRATPRRLLRTLEFMTTKRDWLVP